MSGGKAEKSLSANARVGRWGGVGHVKREAMILNAKTRIDDKKRGRREEGLKR